MKNLFCKCLRSIVALTATCLVGRAALVDATWQGAGVTEWEIPANWVEGVVPGKTATPDYSVLIDASTATDYTQVNITSNTQVARLDLFGNLGLGQPNELRIRDFFQFRAGTLNGYGGVYHLLGNAEFSTFRTKYLATSQLHMHGLSRWTGGSLEFALYSYVQNHAGAVLSVETGGYFGSPGTTSSAQVVNDGTIQVNIPNGLTRWYSDITNSAIGLIDIQAGQMVFQGRFTTAGRLKVASGASALMRFLASFEGTQVENSGLITLEGSSALSANTVLPGKVILLNTLGGPGNLTVGEMEWRGGYIEGPGALIIPPGGSLDTYGMNLMHTRPLLNQGTLHIHKDSYPRTAVEATNDGTVLIEGGSF